MTQISTINQGTVPSDVRECRSAAFDASGHADSGQRSASEYGCVDWYPYADDEQTELLGDEYRALS